MGALLVDVEKVSLLVSPMYCVRLQSEAVLSDVEPSVASCANAQSSSGSRHSDENLRERPAFVVLVTRFLIQMTSGS
jgi:hypothetical protein